MKTKIAITGHRGFIGSHLLNKLNGYWIFGEYDVVEGRSIFDDIIDYTINQANTLIHLAALTRVKESFENPEEYIKTNTLGTARMLELCLKKNTKLIYVSSAAVKDPDSSPYAKSKYLAEKIIEPFLESRKVTVLRLENVYGKGMKRGTCLYNFLHNKEMVVDGDGQQARDYIHVEDVADVIVKAIENDWSGKVIPVGSGHTTTVNQIAEWVNKITGKPIVYNKNNDGGIDYSFADIGLITELYPDYQKHTLYDWIKEECDKSK